MRVSKEVQIGKAGEYLVCADLIMKGFVAFPSEQGMLPYDLILDTGEKLLRIQVKTASAPSIVPQRKKDSYTYRFDVKRTGKHGRRQYSDEELDIFALACLDTRQIGYIKNNSIPNLVSFRSDALRGTYYDEAGVQTYAKVVELSKAAMSKKEIADALGITVSMVSKYLLHGYSAPPIRGHYFSEIIRDSNWFYDNF